MTIYRAKDYQDMSRKAANIISAQMILNQTVSLDWPQDPHRWYLQGFGCPVSEG